MKLLKSPKVIPYLIVLIASIIMGVMILSDEEPTRTFPVLLFMSAKLGVVFAMIELGMSYLGVYKEKEDVYKSISRAISAFGMAMCFVLLIAAFESSQ